jgi:hypothetical protein
MPVVFVCFPIYAVVGMAGTYPQAVQKEKKAARKVQNQANDV